MQALAEKHNLKLEPTHLRRQHITIASSGVRIHTDHWLPKKLAASAKLTSTSGSISLIDHGLLMGEESPICDSGRPTAAFYIHGCPLRCKTCYQPEFFESKGILSLSIEQIVSLVETYKSEGASSISIVIGTAQPNVTKLLESLKTMRLGIPLVYNYSGLLSVSALDRLEKTVNIFVPDLKALSQNLLKFHGLSADYPRIACQGIKYLCDSTHKKIILRHLLVPSYISYVEEAKLILAFAGSLQRPPIVSFLVNYLDKNENRMISTPKEVRDELLEYGRQLNLTVLAN